MITLYENILNSTNSGKKAKLSEKYFLDKGFHRTRVGGAFEITLPGPKYFYIYTWKDKFYVKIPRNDKGIIQDTKYFIETYSDFDLVMDYWYSIVNKESDKNIMLKKQLIKEKLKRF